MKKKSKYKPRGVRLDNLSWIIAGMKRHTQLWTGKNGSCLATCVASLLDLELEEVPHFAAFVRWMEASFLLFGMAMPLALLLVILVLWFWPMTIKAQRRTFVLLEVLNAWSALDVFCVAIAAALLEIQQFASFIVGDSCDGINEILSKYLDPYLDGDDKCFDVVATLMDVSLNHCFC